MRPTTLLWAGLTGVGLAGSIIAAYVIVRGPFLGGPLLPPRELLIACGAFLVGSIVLAGAGAKLYGAMTATDDSERAVYKTDRGVDPGHRQY